MYMIKEYWFYIACVVISLSSGSKLIEQYDISVYLATSSAFVAGMISSYYLLMHDFNRHVKIIQRLKEWEPNNNG